MRTIHKFHIDDPQNIVIDLPVQAKILTVQMDQGREHGPCLWALIPDTEAPKIARRFKIYGTGHDILESLARLEYIGTFQMDSPMGNLVWHLFEVG